MMTCNFTRKYNRDWFNISLIGVLTLICIQYLNAFLTDMLKPSKWEFKAVSCAHLTTNKDYFLPLERLEIIENLTRF